MKKVKGKPWCMGDRTCFCPEDDLQGQETLCEGCLDLSLFSLKRTREIFRRAKSVRGLDAMVRFVERSQVARSVQFLNVRGCRGWQRNGTVRRMVERRVKV